MVKQSLINFLAAISLISVKMLGFGLQNLTSLLTTWLVAGKDDRQPLLS